MEDFLSLFDDKSLFKIGFDKGGIGVGDLFIFDGKAALLNEAAAFALGGGQASLYQQVQHSDLAIGEVPVCQLGGGHVGCVGPSAEQGASTRTQSKAP